MIEELKMSRNGRGRGHLSKAKCAVIVWVVALTAIVIGATIATNQPKTKPKASEYLQVTPMEGGSLGEYESDNRAVMIKTLGLNITAFRGDAHSIIVIVASQAEPEVLPNPPTYFLPKGESCQAPMLLRGLMSHLNADGLFPVKISIKCNESDPSDIWLFLKPEDILSMGGPD